MAVNFPLDKAQLLALCLESIVFGMFCPLFVGAVYVIYGRRSLVFYKVMLAILCAMLIIAAARLGTSLARIFLAFTSHDPEEITPAIAYYQKLSDPLETVKSFLFVTQTLIGDSFVIYRVWVVWNKSILVTLLPLCLLVGGAVAGYGVTFKLQVSSPGQSIFEFLPWITADFSLTLATNVLCTSLIAVRIWRTNVSRKGGAAGSRSLLPVIMVIVESAAIYSAALLSLLIVYLNDSNGQYPALDLVTPLIGIVFSMIVVRVHFQQSQQQNLLSHHPGSSQIQSGFGTSRKGDNFIELRNIQNGVTISTHVHKHSDKDMNDMTHKFGEV